MRGPTPGMLINRIQMRNISPASVVASGPSSSKRFTKLTHFVVPTVAAKCTSSPYVKWPAEELEKMVRHLPAGYIGATQDVVGVVNLLLSEEGRYVNASYFLSPDLLTRRLSRASLPGPVAANKRKMKQYKTALSPEFMTGQKPRGRWEIK